MGVYRVWSGDRGFVVDAHTGKVCGDDGVERPIAKSNHRRYLLLLLRNAPDAVWNRNAAKELGVSTEFLRQAVVAVRRAFGDPAREPRFIETVPDGYRFAAELRRQEVAVSRGRKEPPLLPEITRALSARGRPEKPAGSDYFVELFRRTAGWSRQQVVFEDLGGAHQMPEEYKGVLKRHELPGGVNELWGLRGVVSEERNTSDSEWSRITLRRIAGDFCHLFAQKWASECREHEECRTTAERYAIQWFERGLAQSPVFHHLNASVSVITGDRRIVLSKRSQSTDFAWNLWSATLEEQMLKKHRMTGAGDADLFAAAERGVEEELAIPAEEIESNRTLLLRGGIEWGTFSAIMCMVVWVERTFQEIVDAIESAPDKQEHVAWDCLELGEIERALGLTEWNPSRDARRRVGWQHLTDDELRAGWHFTSRARLYALAQYLALPK